MLRCCQPQSSPLFTNSLRSIDAGQRGENDNINQSWRHNDPNQPEITGNVTMNYVSVAAAAGSPRLSAGCAASRCESGHPTVIIDSDISPLALKGRRAAAKILSRFSQLPVRAARRRSREERPFLPRGL